MRSVIVVAIVALLIGVTAAWLANHPGELTINWFSWHLETPVSVALLVIAAALIIALGIQRLLYWFRNEAPFSARRRQEARQRRGEQALFRGIAALKLGDSSDALRQSKEASRLLGSRPMVLVLAAEAAEANDDRAAATAHYRAMLDIEDTVLLGVRGLMTQTLGMADYDQALILSDRAIGLAPKSPWVLETRMDILIRLNQWEQARETLQKREKLKQLNPAASNHLRAVLNYCEAVEEDLAGHHEQALNLVLEAHKKAPDLNAAATFAARLLTHDNNQRKAARILEESWRAAPHPQIARSYLDLAEDENATEQFRRAARLAALNPNHIESRILVAETAMTANHPGDARASLEKAMAHNPTTRAFLLMAKLERQQPGHENGAKNWESKAVSAPPDPAWICDRCGTHSPLWQPRCNSCHAFGSLSWQSVGQASLTKPAVEKHHSHRLLTFHNRKNN